MSLAEKIASLVPPTNQENMKEISQLEIADELEKTLGDLGIQVQPRFDIPLANRLTSIRTKVYSQDE